MRAEPWHSSTNESGPGCPEDKWNQTYLAVLVDVLLLQFAHSSGINIYYPDFHIAALPENPSQQVKLNLDSLNQIFESTREWGDRAFFKYRSLSVVKCNRSYLHNWERGIPNSISSSTLFLPRIYFSSFSTSNRVVHSHWSRSSKYCALIGGNFIGHFLAFRVLLWHDKWIMHRKNLHPYAITTQPLICVLWHRPWQTSMLRFHQSEHSIWTDLDQWECPTLTSMDLFWASRRRSVSVRDSLGVERTGRDSRGSDRPSPPPPCTARYIIENKVNTSESRQSVPEFKCCFEMLTPLLFPMIILFSLFFFLKMSNDCDNTSGSLK